MNWKSQSRRGRKPTSVRMLKTTPQEQEMVKRDIESTDGMIDRLVYELYGLTEEEIKIVDLDLS
jgi:hypothetical protein